MKCCTPDRSAWCGDSSGRRRSGSEAPRSPAGDESNGGCLSGPLQTVVSRRMGILQFRDDEWVVRLMHSPRRDERLAELLAGLVEQARDGRAPDVETVARENPDLAVELRELW